MQYTPSSYNPAAQPNAGGSSAPQSPQQAYSTGYTPVSFDAPYGAGPSPEVFYGSLIDGSARPTEVYCRLVDALFFFMDQNCDIPHLRGTQHIELDKYAWVQRRLGISEQNVQTIRGALQSFYDMAAVPYRVVSVNGVQEPILDRRGFLHMAVFDARSVPADAHQHWNKVLNTFALVDPATNTPFPTPLPRAAWPAYADYTLQAAYNTWKMQVAVAASRAASNATVAAILGRPGYGYGYGYGAAPVPGAANPFAAVQQQQIDMYSKMQAQQRRTSMVKTATTLMSTFMGGGLGGGFTGTGS